MIGNSTDGGLDHPNQSIEISALTPMTTPCMLKIYTIYAAVTREITRWSLIWESAVGTSSI